MSIIKDGERLTDYAVDIRYPMLLEEPTKGEAEEAIEIAVRIKEFVLKRLPLREKND